LVFAGLKVQLGGFPVDALIVRQIFYFTFYFRVEKNQGQVAMPEQKVRIGGSLGKGDVDAFATNIDLFSRG